MRFMSFVFALFAIFGGAHALNEELCHIELNINGNSQTVKHDTCGDKLAGMTKQMNTNSNTHAFDAAGVPIITPLAFPWTRIAVGNALNDVTFYQLRIQVLSGTTYIDAGTSSSTDPRGEYYGSVAQVSPSGTNTAGLTKLNKDTLNGGGGDYVLRAYDEAGASTQETIIAQYQGTAATGWWPRDALNAGADKRFKFLYVQIVFPDSGNFIGTIKIGFYSSTGGGSCTTGACGDPQFIGLQGQNYQFHGIPDEVFSLVSSPELQMNSLFKFISSGKCDYNDTTCWTHPGTYLGQVGIQYGADKILLQSGSHEEGMKVFINGKALTPSKHIHQFSLSNETALAQFKTPSKFVFNSERFFISLHNSDYFFNLEFGLKDQSILSIGAAPVRITGEICERENRVHKILEPHTKSEIAAKLNAAYPHYPVHGLVGQTWRNAEYCGRYFEGTVDDYVVDSLFGAEHTFNFFSQ